MKAMNGIFTALLTPFCDDGSINRDALQKLIRFNIDSDVHGFYVGGSTAEAMMMADEQRKELFEIVKGTAGDEVRLIAHVGSTATDSAVSMALTAQKLGYDAVSAVAPFYYGHTLDAVKQYYLDIAAAADMPVFIYNFSLGTGFNLTPDIAADLFSRDSRFAGVKHTSLDLFALQQFKERIPGITVLNGFDEVCLGGLAMGADGAIGSTYNFMGKKFVAIYNAFCSGDLAAAQKLQNEACHIIAVMCRYGVMQCEKEILTQMGVADMGQCRRPFLPLTQEGKQAVSELIPLL